MLWHTAGEPSICPLHLACRSVITSFALFSAGLPFHALNMYVAVTAQHAQQEQPGPVVSISFSRDEHSMIIAAGADMGHIAALHTCMVWSDEKATWLLLVCIRDTCAAAWHATAYLPLLHWGLRFPSAGLPTLAMCF